MQGDKGTWIGRGVGPPRDRIRARGGGGTTRKETKEQAWPPCLGLRQKLLMTQITDRP